LIAPKKFNGQKFTRVKKNVSEYRAGFIIVNPLYKIDWIKGEAVPAPEGMDFGGETLFFRHPMYQQRLQKMSPVQLDDLDRLILYWAMRIKSIDEIANILNMEAKEIFRRVLDLESKELIQVQNVTQSMAKLQAYYWRQEVPYTNNDATLQALWKRTILLHKEKPFIVWPSDDSVFTYSDADLIVRMSAAYLADQGVKAGDRIVIDAISHPEFLFIFWAGILLGAVVVPVNPEMKEDAYEIVLQRTRPRLIFTNVKSPKSIVFGVNENSDAYQGSFSEKVTEYEPHNNFPECFENHDAVILFTSGSTGKPKGVVLSHGALFRTSHIMDRAYGWRSNDRFLGGGYFHTMSGLRNPAIAVLHSGGSVIVPGNENIQDPMSLMNVCLKYQASILNVPPAFLAYWRVAEKKIQYYQSHKMRMVLSTGSALHFAHRENFEKHFRIPIYDYYGLTETTGACILQTPHHTGEEEPGVGKPKGCLVKIVNSKGETLEQGATGELAIYSDNLMQGYLGDEAKTKKRIRNGWFMTGDTARINENGFVILTGRIDRMMIDKNGENVYPEEIEKEICSTEGVTDAYVTQIQDQMQIDQIAALVQFVALNDNSDALVSRLRTSLAERLPMLQIPAIILAVEEIPKGTTGKASTADCRKLIEEYLER
jgi:acyl-coenzyme A synthetase/AMP-(fatty) acid ligase